LGVLVILPTRRLQRYIHRQGGNPLQPCAQRRVGFEVEAALGGDGWVNVEGDIGYCGPISHEDLMVALAHARDIALVYLQSTGQQNHTSGCFVLVT
jgi:hypothetical protein